MPDDGHEAERAGVVQRLADDRWHWALELAEAIAEAPDGVPAAAEQLMNGTGLLLTLRRERAANSGKHHTQAGAW